MKLCRSKAVASVNPCKVLFITGDFSKYVQRSFHHFSMALSELVNLSLWHKSGHIRDILKGLPERPDFILLNDIRERHCPRIEGLAELDIPVGAIVHDTHFNIEERKAFLKTNHIKHIFTIYRDPFLKLFPEFAHQMHWFPHFVDTKIFRDYELKRDIDYLLLGCTAASVYPLRKVMLDRMKSRKGFYHEEHPGYRDMTAEEENKVLVNRNYAKAINRAKIFLSCDSTYHYPLRKYYEVLACRTLLLSSVSKELLDLGFIPGVHFVEVTEDNFEWKAQYYLKNRAERNRIAEAGYEFIRKHHTVKHRARKFVDTIQEILNNPR